MCYVLVLKEVPCGKQAESGIRNKRFFNPQAVSHCTLMTKWLAKTHDLKLSHSHFYFIYAHLRSMTEARHNTIALCAGAVLQRPAGIAFLYGISLGTICTGPLLFVSVLDAKIATAALVAGGAVMTTLTWLLHNAPFDTMKMLEKTIETMEETERDLEANVTRMSEENAALKVAADDIGRTADAMSLELREQKMVREGMQSTLNTLLGDIGKSNGVLESLTAEMQEEMNSTEAVRGKFMEAITGLSAEREKTASLTQELKTVASSNHNLLKQMLQLSADMESIVGELHDADFASQVEDIVRMTDALADKGIRSKLSGTEALNQEERQDMLGMLIRMDEVLKDAYGAHNARSVSLADGSLRALNRCRSMLVESTA